MNCAAFFATRSVLVPTARTAPGGKPRSRSPNRASASSARSWVARSRRRSRVEAAAEPDRLAQRVEEVDLAVDDPSDLEVEAVRPEVDGGERVELHECGLGGGGPAHLSTRGVPQQRPRRYDFTAASISSSETCRTSLPFVM